MSVDTAGDRPPISETISELVDSKAGEIMIVRFDTPNHEILFSTVETDGTLTMSPETLLANLRKSQGSPHEPGSETDSWLKEQRRLLRLYRQ